MPREWLPDTPIYKQIADELRARITSGELGPGAKIPGENKLMPEYGVSRDTARKALAILKAQGLTETKRGSGTTVRSFRPIPRIAPDRLAAKQWGTGKAIWDYDTDRRPRRTEATVDEAPAPGHIAQRFEINPGAVVCRRVRRYFVDETPVQLATSYLPLDIVAGSPITELNPGDGGIYARLKDLGHGPTDFIERLQARMPSPDEAHQLDLSDGTPVIEIARIAKDAAGRIVEINEMLLSAPAYVLEYNFPA
jgi:GntR family transcriptional regulator